MPSTMILKSGEVCQTQWYFVSSHGGSELDKSKFKLKHITIRSENHDENYYKQTACKI